MQPMTSTTLTRDTCAMIFKQKGLMAELGLHGSKITSKTFAAAIDRCRISIVSARPICSRIGSITVSSGKAIPREASAR